MRTLLVAVRLLKERERERETERDRERQRDREETGRGGVQSVHVDSVHEDYISRAPSGGWFVYTLVREVSVLERDHNSICDEKENETLKKCRYSSQSGGRFSKGDQFVSVSELCTCVTTGCTASPFDVNLQD